MKKAFWMVFTLALSVLTVWAVLKQSESMSISALLQKIAQADKKWIVIAMISALGYVFFEAVALCSILKGIGYKVNIRKGLLYSTADVYFSAVTPSATGGQPASAFFMLKHGIKAGVTSAALVLNVMMYNLAIVFLGLVAIIINPRALLAFHTSSKVFIILGFIGLTLLSLFFLSVLKGSEKVFSLLRGLLSILYDKKIIHHLERRMKKLDKIEADYENCSSLISNRWDIMIKAFFWNVLQRASQILVPAFAYIAMTGEKGFVGEMFSKQCLINIGYNYVPIPGALGIADYLMIDGFSSIMSKGTAFEIDMISRGMTFYLCVTLSGVITLIGYLKGRKIKK
ncbi:MAG: flippase-like domain-containing protein [Pseudobutyrivibrio sp.]|nr:flippase-like domain-containing protein [Pseudobutyrivibrio sp.]